MRFLTRTLAALVVLLPLAASAQTYTGTTFRWAGGPITTFATGPTDWVVLTGSATKTVTVSHIAVCGTATVAATIDVTIIKRSTTNTGGTSSAGTAVNLSDSNVAATATMSVYTANPTIGTAVGNADVKKLNLGPPGSAGCVLLDYGTRDGSGPITLLTTGHLIAINLLGQTVPAGLSLDYMIETNER